MTGLSRRATSASGPGQYRACARSGLTRSDSGLAARVPLPRVPLVRYAGCLAPHSKLREAMIPTPHQQGVDGDEAKTGTLSWSWARLPGACVCAGYDHPSLMPMRLAPH